MKTKLVYFNDRSKNLVKMENLERVNLPEIDDVDECPCIDHECGYCIDCGEYDEFYIDKIFGSSD